MSHPKTRRAFSRVTPERRYNDMRRATGAVAFFVSLLLPLALVSTPAQAAAMHHWYGKVTKVQDGDTIYVDVKGDGTHRSVPIRNAGIQATEIVPKVECHAKGARQYFRSILKKGTKVRLSALHKNSTAGLDGAGRLRYWRYVDKWVPSTHRWVDVQAMLLRHGDVMWLAHKAEGARIGAYHRYMQEGMAKRTRLWDNNHCGNGPAQSANLRMWLNYDANGRDANVKNGEWMRVQNNGATDVSIAGWKLRNASKVFNHGGNYYTIPKGTVVWAGRTITFFLGSGTNNPGAGRIYLGMNSQLGNVQDPRKGYPGKTIYLLDPQYDFRFVADYPCMVGCAPDPPVHISHVQSTTSNDEYVDLQVTPGSSPADLSGVVVENDGWTKEIAPGTVLNSGETLRVWCDKAGTDQKTGGSGGVLNQYWGARSGTMLSDAGDTINLRTATSHVLDVYKWGTG
jgi:endonuclease YncB( thermonuclease family)